eukprot:TRINITY_DN973_c0_g1_i1.p1 TRINITY_DN973_c0_g1~~TRINITY_DN973_c0_g1_i1.p1  ORF type:complete len:236 (+),score=57.51 TRINITY_DN973_c0_g1_i1:69-776(+)
MNENANDLTSSETLPDEEYLSPNTIDRFQKHSPYSKSFLDNLPSVAFPYNFPSPYTSFLSPKRNNYLPSILKRSSDKFATPLDNVPPSNKIKTAPAKVSRPLNFSSDLGSPHNPLNLFDKFYKEAKTNVGINGDESLKKDEIYMAICKECKNLSNNVICEKCAQISPLVSSKIMKHCHKALNELDSINISNSSTDSNSNTKEINEKQKNNLMNNDNSKFDYIRQQIAYIQQLLVV